MYKYAVQVRKQTVRDFVDGPKLVLQVSRLTERREHII